MEQEKAFPLGPSGSWLAFSSPLSATLCQVCVLWMTNRTQGTKAPFQELLCVIPYITPAKSPQLNFKITVITKACCSIICLRLLGGEGSVDGQAAMKLPWWPSPAPSQAHPPWQRGLIYSVGGTSQSHPKTTKPMEACITLHPLYKAFPCHCTPYLEEDC